jgi:diketogulonate reductase-like aldo/keto reductase
MQRRDLLCAAAVSAGLPSALAQAQPEPLLTRTIPSSGLVVPAVGLGTWQTFDVPISDLEALARRREVLERFFALGGRAIDSSPMYGYAEAVLGELMRGQDQRLIAMSKVWTGIASYGTTQMGRSYGLWRLPRLDVMLVHNLLAWRAHLKTLRDWQAQGRVGHIGISTSHGRAADEVRQILNAERIDVLQITYSPVDRSAEPLLALAAQRGVAVVINRPFDGGNLLERLRRVPLPGVVRNLGCTSWAESVLKWELANPAVTCAIPATTDPLHVAQNLAALRGPLPDARQRQALLSAILAAA